MNLSDLRILFDCVWGDLRPGDGHLPRLKKELTLYQKLAGYFWQIVELVDPTLFFPKRFPLAFDRMFLSLPTSSVIRAADRKDPFASFQGDVSLEDPALAKEYELSCLLAHVQWQSAIESGISPLKRYISPFPEQPVENTTVTIWREKKGNEWSTKTMGASMFLVAGTLAPELGMGAEPQFVSSIHLLWEKDYLQVVWETSIGSLISTWAIVGNFIWSGVADAGLLQALLDLPEGPGSDTLTQFTVDKLHRMWQKRFSKRGGTSIFSTPKFGRVQQSIFDKWNFRTKPTSVPIQLCDTHDNFKLVDTRLDDFPLGSDYAAISYTWGDWTDKNELHLEILEVVKEIGTRYAWVDAWCINNDTRADEIPRMGEYYANASVVIVLLPDVAKRTAYTNLTHGAPFNLRKARADDGALGQAILRSTWRSRVWTLQEGLLAQNCIGKTRDQMLDGEYLDHLLHFPEHCMFAQYASLGHTHSLHSPVTNVRGYWKEDWHTGSQSAVSGAHKASLLEVLKMGNGRRCKVPLDSLIGLLGLVDGPTLPPMSAETAQWSSLWTTLIRSGTVGIDVLRVASACQETEIGGIDGEMQAQSINVTDHGLEVMGTPVEVIIGEKSEQGLRQIPNQRDIAIVVDHGNEIKTHGQVSASAGDKFIGIILESQPGDKGVTVLLGEWTDSIRDTRLFYRHTSVNVVRVLKLVRAVQAVQQIQITIGLS
ncbi:hypothetical protein BU24DRAFT_416018 [Aaosphaeria arxii CBS 175.79]|uniref:Heterokaryon incompatibility domain-containing protein n=1 Tax=Aaosphaeria arxii CBS 175.79 TaxID=1450172 RepID=A0A6A5X5W8_9PLEO|nr:uncharacterized protein BU24DRAFT_416018 [Aaosphaeria arxii CBS 175.79]KAF2008290.1 hypothetical protein BU24DRAFT_416018 [Aaosphaeria arxii CBS 175.79]